MGWTVLYIAFGIVALWLLGEVLLQYKARLRWRLLAFAGFLGVVAGVLLASVLVIGVGAAAFAVGQTYVTLSFRSGFADGWAVNKPRGDRQYDDEPGHGPDTGGYERPGRGGRDQGYDDGYDDGPADDFAAPNRAESSAVYEPQPLPDDTDPYGVYGGDTAYAGAGAAPGAEAPYAPAGQSSDQAYAYDGYSGYDQQGQQAYASYDTGAQQQYSGYSDPYATGQNYDTTGYDSSYGQQGYGQQVYGQDQYGGGYGGDTGGAWVPQQRAADDPYGAEVPPEQPPAYPPYQGNGYDEQQYRY